MQVQDFFLGGLDKSLNTVSKMTGGFVDLSGEGALSRQMKKLLENQTKDTVDNDTIRAIIRAIQFEQSPTLQLDALMVAIQISDDGTFHCEFCPLVTHLIVLCWAEENKKALVSLGIIAAMVPLASAEEKTQYAVAKCLWQLSKLREINLKRQLCITIILPFTARNRPIIVVQQGLIAIETIASSGISHSQFAALRALSYITDTDTLRRQVLETQLPTALCGQLIQSPAEQVQFVAAINIQNLAKTGKNPFNPSSHMKMDDIVETHACFMDKNFHKHLIELTKKSEDNPRQAVLYAIQAMAQNG